MRPSKCRKNCFANIVIIQKTRCRLEEIIVINIDVDVRDISHWIASFLDKYAST